ncbi:unnamed protein product [Blepharisma stoltei]|uniref:BTB domain-containing protein n=1 Tax=Blepharisma stoltei TaxID=1481888 RepID=A0AAU9KC05_9CILI|nr:unnamed protein product [Blepharisma stoltei]
MNAFDIIIQIGNLHLTCPKSLLAENSDYFRSLFQGSYSDSDSSFFRLPDHFSFTGFYHIYELMHRKDTLPYDTQIALEVLEIADFLQVSRSLFQLILAYIKIHSDNATFWLSMCEGKEEWNELKSKVLKICKEEINEIIYDENLKSFKLENLFEIFDTSRVYQLNADDVSQMLDTLFWVQGNSSISKLLQTIRDHYESASQNEDSSFSWKIGSLDYDQNQNGYYKRTFESATDVWCLKSKISERLYISVFTAHQKCKNKGHANVKSLFYKYQMQSANGNFVKSSLFGFPVDWNCCYGPARFCEVSDMSKDSTLEVWIKEIPLHGAILSYIVDSIETISTDFSEQELLFFNPKDMFSVIESCHVMNKSEDTICYLLARYLIHHPDECAGIIETLRMYSMSLEMLQTVSNLPYFDSLPDTFKTKVLKEFGTRVTPKLEKLELPSSRSVLRVLNSNSLNMR